MSSPITALISSKVIAYDIKACVHLDTAGKGGEERSAREDRGTEKRRENPLSVATIESRGCKKGDLSSRSEI